MLYMQVPSSRFSDFTVSPIFFPSVPLMKPLTLWACQDAASMISARVAPLARRSNSKIVEVLLPLRAPSDFDFAAFGALPAVLPGRAFLGFPTAAALGLAALAAFAAFDAPVLASSSREPSPAQYWRFCTPASAAGCIGGLYALAGHLVCSPSAAIAA
jgi:hypothetical protein